MGELRPIVLAKPPHKKHLKEELLQVMSLQAEAQPAKNLMEHVRKKDVDVYWMTCVLHMLQPEHQFFHKSYSRVSRQANRGQLQPINEEHFANY